jgi:hypothetical protein
MCSMLSVTSQSMTQVISLEAHTLLKPIAAAAHPFVTQAPPHATACTVCTFTRSSTFIPYN